MFGLQFTLRFPCVGADSLISWSDANDYAHWSRLIGVMYEIHMLDSELSAVILRPLLALGYNDLLTNAVSP